MLYLREIMRLVSQLFLAVLITLLFIWLDTHLLDHQAQHNPFQGVD